MSRDGLEHVDYVPTQVVTEWFRHVFQTEDGAHVDGVIYPSARFDGGVCCVLFLDAAACCDFRPGWQADPTKLIALETFMTCRTDIDA